MSELMIYMKMSELIGLLYIWGWVDWWNCKDDKIINEDK
jgi:hypothetical protein